MTQENCGQSKYPEENSINEKPKEGPITVKSKDKLSIKILRSFMTFNDFCVTKNSFWLYGSGT